ncbi:MAG: hypothetical protein RBS43_03310 [Candidatus Cloacimonas sp.]|nr:hypothetical protein [Candidatus Cloacimonas sp.]
MVYVTVLGNGYPESSSEDTLVTRADDALIPEAEHPNATDDGKELIEARHPLKKMVTLGVAKTCDLKNGDTICNFT